MLIQHKTSNVTEQPYSAGTNKTKQTSVYKIFREIPFEKASRDAVDWQKFVSLTTKF